VDIEVFGVVYIFVCAVLYRVEYSGFEVEKNSAGDVSCIVGLVEKDIFAVTAFGREVLEIAVLVDAVLLT
jgi:hypothetical protein